MKIAICFSGQIRTGIQAAPNIKRFIGDLWDDCDFFIHTWDISRNKPTPTQVIKYGGFYIGDRQDVDFNEFKEIYNFTASSITTPVTGEYSSCLWWSWLYSIQLKQQHEIANNMKYDYVVKIRPDVIYHDSVTLRDIINNTHNNSFSVSESWSSPEGISTVDDVLYVSNSHTMDLAVNSVTDCLLSDPISSSQTKFCKYLNINNIAINNLRIGYFSNKYTVLRQQCIHYCPITEFEKCAIMDKSIFYPSPKVEKIT